MTLRGGGSFCQYKHFIWCHCPGAAGLLFPCHTVLPGGAWPRTNTASYVFKTYWELIAVICWRGIFKIQNNPLVTLCTCWWPVLLQLDPEGLQLCCRSSLLALTYQKRFGPGISRKHHRHSHFGSLLMGLAENQKVLSSRGHRQPGSCQLIKCVPTLPSHACQSISAGALSPAVGLNLFSILGISSKPELSVFWAIFYFGDKFQCFLYIQYFI